MEFVKHPQHTRYWGAPKGWDESKAGPCGALSVQDKKSGPYAVMESAWMPTPQEAVALSLGIHQIRLGIFGNQHPVVYMGTAMVTDLVPRPEMMKRIEAAAQWLADIAQGYQMQLTVATVGLGEAAKPEAAVVDKERK